MNGQSKQIYEFGDFRLDKPERLLTRAGKPLALTPKAFDLLVLLIENQGSLLSKDELMNAVWADSFVEEANLNVNISTLRKVLGESSFIETVPKKGYRFAAEVREIVPTVREIKTAAPEEFVIANFTQTRIVREEEIDEANDGERLMLPAGRPRNKRKSIAALLIGAFAVAIIGAFFYYRQTNAPNAEASELYLRGREAMERRNAEDIKRALRFFESAIEKDEKFALAHAGLSDAYSYLGDYDVLPPEEIHRKSKAAARRAIELDDTLGKAHLSLGNMLRDEWDYAESEKQIKRAIELEPNNAEAHHIYSHLLLDQERFDESLRESLLNLQLDPHSTAPRLHLGQHYFYARQYDEAIKTLEETIRLDPNYSRAFLYISHAYELSGQNDKAVAAYLKSKTLTGADVPSISRLQTAYDAGGMKNFWQEELTQTLEKARQKYIAPYNIALLYARLGEKDKAFEYLEKAYNERSPLLAPIRCDRELDNLRDDARFADLLRRIGLDKN